MQNICHGLDKFADGRVVTVQIHRRWIESRGTALSMSESYIQCHMNDKSVTDWMRTVWDLSGLLRNLSAVIT